MASIMIRALSLGDGFDTAGAYNGDEYGGESLFHDGSISWELLMFSP